jgi:hypothetical protein
VETLNDGEVLYVREPGLTVTLNQRNAPNDLQFAGRGWERLGVITVTPDATSPDSPAIEVLITQASGGIVAADGVILRRVDTALPELRLLTLTDNPLDERSQGIFVDVLESRASALGLTAVNPGPVDGDFVNDLEMKAMSGLDDGTLPPLPSSLRSAARQRRPCRPLWHSHRPARRALDSDSTPMRSSSRS